MDARLERLRELVCAQGRLIVAYSGGVDSALLAAVAAQELGSGGLAVTAVSPSLPAAERSAAAAFAHAHGIAHVEVCTDEGDRPDYVANGADRCAHCKDALLDALEPMSVLAGARIALGVNADDLGDHRPGQQRAADRGAIFPLLDVGFTKNDVREASAYLGLEVADKPAAACLASRVAYGEPVTPELLARIEAAEDSMRALGFAVCRVRSHGNGTVARLEIYDADWQRAATLRTEIDTAVRAAGFSFSALDLAGFASGRMNVLLGMPTAGAP